MSRKKVYKAITLIVNLTLLCSDLSFAANHHSYFNDLCNDYCSVVVAKDTASPVEFCFSEYRITPPTYAKAR